jgi:hypothetical protein
MTLFAQIERQADRLAPAMFLFLGLISAFATAGVTI